MQGILRFILAAFVVLTHLAGFSLGPHAIYGFYLVSGFLMTLILHETYHFQFKEFAINRFLRLYPTYYLVVVMSLIAFALFPSYQAFHKAWGFESIGLKEIMGNGLIFPLEFYPKDQGMRPISMRVVPTSWSIAVELVCYFLLWLVVSRGFRIAIASLIIASAYHIAVSDMPWGYRYYPFFSALLPFSSGVVAYFVYKRLVNIEHMVRQSILFVSVMLWMLGLYLHQEGYSWYINIVALFLFMVSATSLDQHYPRVKMLGKVLGSLAYPVFLCHWIVAFVIANLLPVQYVLYVAIPAMLVISWGLVRVSDLIVEPYRDRVRFSVTKPAAHEQG